jgi:flagellar biosynthetic protein FliR
MAGVIFINPIFGRRNVPSMVKIGLAMGLALNASYGMLDIPVADYTVIDILLAVTREIAVGLALGFVVQLFLSIFHLGGELIDLQMGVSMALMYDPTSNSQISISGNLLTVMYTLLFFITNSHINLLAIAVKSYQVVPIGIGGVSEKIGIYFFELFGHILVYSIQLALPVIVTEILVEVAVGILMRMVPNINVFVVNLQLKLMVGMIVIITIIPVLVHFMSKLNMIMMERLEKVLLYFM